MSTDCWPLKIKNDWKNILGKYKLAHGHASRKRKKLLQSRINKNTQMKMLEKISQQR